MTEGFFVTELPQTAMTGHYNWWLVLASYLIASAACFIAITLVAGIRGTDTPLQKKAPLLGAFFMGGGIWSMHFTGMLAYDMGMAHTYSVPLTSASFLVAITFSWFAFQQILKPVLSNQALVASAFVIGTGVTLMHYTGMAAMEMAADLHYRPGLFTLSVVIAVLAGGAAILIIRQFLQQSRVYWSILAAGVMGLAVCGMHYTGMEAAVFIPYATGHIDTDHSHTWLAAMVCVVAFALIIVPGFVISLNRLVNRSRADGGERSPRWHYIYYVLAGFSIATVAFSFFLNHKIMTLHDDLADINKAWIERQSRIIEASRLTMAANAPGNDVFESGDVEGETKKLITLSALVVLQYDKILSGLEQLDAANFPSGTTENGKAYKALLLAKLALFRTDFEKLKSESLEIFSSIRDEDLDNAGIHMAAMDSQVRAASNHLSDAEQIVSEIQITLFSEQLERANALKAVRFIVAGLMLLLVASATLYGHRLAQMSKREEEKKWFQRKSLDLISSVQSTYIASKERDIGAVCEVLLSNLLELSHSEFGFIGEVFCKEDGTPQLDIRAASDVVRDNEKSGALGFCGPDRLCERVITTGVPFIGSHPADQIPGDVGPQGGLLLSHSMVIPIFASSEVIGIVGLANKVDGYTEKDIVLLESVIRTVEAIFDSIRDRREQELTHKKLVESQKLGTHITNRLQGILDNTEALVYMKDARGRILLANKNLCDQLNCSEEEILGKTDYDFLPEDYADGLARHDKRILETLKPEQTEEHVAMQGRSPRHFLSMKFPLYDEMLQEHIVCGISTDITGIKKAQRSVEESNTWLDSIMHTVPEGILTVESDGTIKSVNRAVCELFGYSKSELEKSSINVLLSEGKHDKHIEFLQTYFLGNSDKTHEMASDREITGLRKDGVEVPLEISLTLVSLSDGEKYAVASVRDITKRKQAEEELKRHRDHLQDMVDEQTRDLAVAHEEAERARLDAESFAVISKNDPYPIVKLNQDGEIVLFNPSADRLFDDLEERGIDHPFLADALSMMEAEGVVNREITIGQITYLQTIVTTNVGDSRVITFYSIDVTPIKKAQREAEWANKMKSEFLGNMSHELRTPMHAIISFSRHGMERIDRWDKDRQVENLERINVSGHRLSGLLNDLLDLTKLEAGSAEYDFKSVDVVSIINAAASEIDILATNKNQFLVLPITPLRELRMECDRGKVHQVVVNLMSNAIKFTPEGKQVSVHCSEDSTANAIHITVSDEGVGIPEEELDTVFDKFIQSSKTKTGAGGTGLGLAICKEIVEGHGGKIWAENNSRGGADFHVSLPMTQELGVQP